MFNMLGNIGANALGLIGSIVNTKQINETNKQIARETNAANREMVQMQNEAAAAESEKAYRRSMPANQVGNMMSAGMSRSGAINALSGGGSYTPAPVNVAQDSAPQMQTTDLSSLANMGQALSNVDIDRVKYSMSDRKEISSIFDVINNNSDELGNSPTLKDVYALLNDKQKKALSNPYVREQVNDFINQSFAQRKDQYAVSLFTYETRNKEYQEQINNLDLELRKIVQNDKITAEQQKHIAESAKAKLEMLQADMSREAFEKMDKDTLIRYAETRATLEWLSHIGEMSAEKVIDKLRTIVGL